MQIYVSQSVVRSGDGTRNHPFRFIQEAAEIARELEKANNALKTTIDGVLAEEKPAMDAIAKELEIMKMSK